MKRRSVVASAHNRSKKQRRKQIILVGGIGGLFVLSIFSVILYAPDEFQGAAFSDSGFQFSITQQGGQAFLTTTVNNQQPLFLFLPSDVANIPGRPDPTIVNAPIIYVAFDPTQEMLDVIDFARFLIGMDFESSGQQVIPAITQPSDIYDFPHIDCTQEPALVVRFGNETSIALDGFCTVIQGETSTDVIRATDRFRFLYHGIAT